LTQLAFGGSYMSIAIDIIVSLLINTLVFLCLISILLLFTGNKNKVNLKYLSIVSFFTVFTTGVYTFISSFLLAYDVGRNLPEFLYYIISPTIFNLLCMPLGACIVSGLTLFVLLKRYAIIYFFQVVVVLSLINNVVFFIFVLAPIPGQDAKMRESQSISVSEQLRIEKSIRVNVISEEIVEDEKNKGYNLIRLKIQVNVPKIGTYILTPDFTNSSGVQGKPYIVRINNQLLDIVAYDGISFSTLTQIIVVDIPYIRPYANGISLNIAPANTEKTLYGPYYFSLNITELQVEDGYVFLSYKSPEYKTKRYDYKLFYR